MKQHKSLSSIIISLVLTQLFAFADFNPSNNDYNNSVTISTRCESQDAPSIFVLEALFANPENPYPIELWQNRDNEQINIFDIAREIKSIANLKEKIFNNTDESKRTQLFERLAQMEDIADRTLFMEADKWKPGYVNELMKHIVGIRHYGISALIPEAFDPSNCKDVPYNISDENRIILQTKFNSRNIVNPCDKNGQHWTSLSRLTQANKGISVANYMQSHGTDIQIIKSWWTHQVSDSWSGGNPAVKVFYSNQRTLDPETYSWESWAYGVKNDYKAAQENYLAFWKNGVSVDRYSERDLNSKGLCYPGTGNKEEIYAKAFTIWHAYVQEILSKSKFPYSNQISQEVCLIKTLGGSTLNSNGIMYFGNDYTMRLAAYESFSLVNIYNNFLGHNPIIESHVPYHRIIHLYPLLPREPFDREAEKYRDISEFIIKNYYDQDGILIIDRKDPSSVEKFIQEYAYNHYLFCYKTEHYNGPYAIKDKQDGPKGKHDFKNGCYYSFVDDEFDAFSILSLLPEKLITEDLHERIRQISEIQVEMFTLFESEAVVLAGPDLPFNYFYNTEVDKNLEHRLSKGEGACGFWPNGKDPDLMKLLKENTGDFIYQDDSKDRKYLIKKTTSEHLVPQNMSDAEYLRNLWNLREKPEEAPQTDLTEELQGYTFSERRAYNTPEGPIDVAVYLKN